MFYVGQKVVCIDDKSCLRAITENWNLDLHGLKVGEVYTIKWIGNFKHKYLGESVCVHLVEINRPNCFLHGVPVPFSLKRFRPLEERKTDISIFEAMLNPNKQDVKV